VARNQTIAPASARFCSMASGIEEQVAPCDKSCPETHSNLCFVSALWHFFWGSQDGYDCTLYTGVLSYALTISPCFDHKPGRLYRSIILGALVCRSMRTTGTRRSLGCYSARVGRQRQVSNVHGQYARRFNRQIRDTSHRVDSRRGKSTSLIPSLQYSPTNL